MSIDQYRNISFSAYIEYDCLDCTGKFAENVLRIFHPFHVDFFLPMWPLLSKPLYIYLYAAAKNVLFSIQKKSVNLGTLQVFNFYHQTPCEMCPIYLFVWKHERIYMEEIWKSEEFVWKCEGVLKKNEKLYGKMLNSTEKVKEFIWQKYGKVKNLYGNVKDL